MVEINLGYTPERRLRVMKKINQKKNKRLTNEDRKEIEECLGKSMVFKHIAKHIAKDPTTVSYEVKHHHME